jgi:hypothetical protein
MTHLGAEALHAATEYIPYLGARRIEPNCCTRRCAPAADRSDMGGGLP